MVIIKDNPEPVSYYATNKIIEQMKNTICRIKIGKNFGTGFFCFIRYKNKKIPVLVSNYHIIDEKIINYGQTISVEIKNEKRNIYLKDKKIYMNNFYDITIIEINPQIDLISNFLELDENIFFENNLNNYRDLNVYLIQTSENDNFISYGKIKGINNEKERSLYHLCSTFHGSGGAPIMNLKNFKIIGIHFGYDKLNNINLGTFLKYPINEFIIKYKDYIESIIELPITYSIGNNENKIKVETNINNLVKMNSEIKNTLKKENEKNRLLEEQIKKLKNLLNNNKNINNYNDLNRAKYDELMKYILKKDKEIEDLKAKLARFPFQLLKGEKLMSINITSIDQNIHCSFICKNTDIFSNIEAKLYQKYKEYSENENFFTVNGKKINKHKNLDDNEIKDNDIIILNVIDY